MIRTSIDGAVATVTLDRPAARNALTLAAWRDMATIFKSLDADPAIRAVILTGAGGGFSAGADIAEFEETRAGVEKALIYEAAYDGACDAIAAVGKPVVAAIEGYCFGGACHLAMACDFRIAAPDARFGIPAAKLSIVYSPTGVARLLALVGLQETRTILYGAEPFAADHALKTGFIDQIADDPLAAARTRLAALEPSAPLSIRGVKTILESLTRARNPDAALSIIRQAMDSADYAEARAAFSEKRKPVFRGI